MSFSLMYPPKELPQVTKLTYPIYVQPIIEGTRAIYMDHHFFDENSNILEVDMEHFDSLAQIEDIVFDGILSLDKLKYTVLDAMPRVDWISRKCQSLYCDRIRAFRSLLNDSIADYKKIIDISTDSVQSAGEVIDLYKEYLNKGYSGVILRAPDGLYKWARVTLKTAEMLKLAPIKEGNNVSNEKI